MFTLIAAVLAATAAVSAVIATVLPVTATVLAVSADVLNTLMKLPFSKEFLNNGTLGSNLIRSARYGIILFVVIGVYPRLFPLFEKVGAKKA